MIARGRGPRAGLGAALAAAGAQLSGKNWGGCCGEISYRSLGGAAGPRSALTAADPGRAPPGGGGGGRGGGGSSHSSPSPLPPPRRSAPSFPIHPAAIDPRLTPRTVPALSPSAPQLRPWRWSPCPGAWQRAPRGGGGDARGTHELVGEGQRRGCGCGGTRFGARLPGKGSGLPQFPHLSTRLLLCLACGKDNMRGFIRSPFSSRCPDAYWGFISRLYHRCLPAVLRRRHVRIS